MIAVNSAFRPVLWRTSDPDGGVHHYCRKPENVAAEVAWATEDGRATIHHGDCLDVMRTMADGSVDAVVCDPPYGLEFMGKDWDRLDGDAWRTGGNFTKPGIGDRATAWPSFGSGDTANATCATCGGRMRGKKRCECAAPDWRVKGKPLGESKADTRQSQGVKMQEWHRLWAVEALRVAKPGAHLLAFGGTRTFHRLTCAIEDAGWEIRDCLSWLYGSGFPKSHNGAWGGTALKPAWEPVIMARKPLIGTVASNVAAHGTGALNIDGCRIDGPKAGGSGQPPLQYGGQNHRPFHDHAEPREFDTTKGRWPANVALDEDAAAALDEQVGVLASGQESAEGHKRRSATNQYGGYAGQEPGDSAGALYGDFGGASRFFYTAKASRSEREAGLREAGRQVLGDYAGTPEHPSKVGAAPARNTHPTVKPVDLMRWLVRLVTPIGGTVLDPFLGSGTTGVAALQEGCRFIGIEREAQYVEIAKARIAHEAAQGSLFK